MSFTNCKGLGTHANDIQDRELRLVKEWHNEMPCANCDIADICRYANSIKRVDYPPAIFDVKVTCKIKHNYRTISEERL